MTVVADKSSLRHRIETITPEMAEKWLEKNLDNRPIRQMHVDMLARDMRLGKWMLTGDPIRFDTDGILIDGQHRLWACLDAGVAFESYVLRGVDPNAKFIIDTGAKRTLGDAFAIGGEPSSHLLAGIVNVCFKMDVARWSNNINPTHAEALEWLEDNPGVRDAARIAHMVRTSIPVAPSPVGAAFYLNARADSELAEEFWTRAAEGTDLKSGESILSWRRWATSMLARRDRPTSRVQFAFHMRAMNLYRDGRTVRLLHWKAEDGIPIAWSETKTRRRSSK